MALKTMKQKALEIDIKWNKTDTTNLTKVNYTISASHILYYPCIGFLFKLTSVNGSCGKNDEGCGREKEEENM